jgi:ribosomal protein S18 acetylase RimI-like enzyme
MNYVEMVCDLLQLPTSDVVVPSELSVKPLADADVEEIYQCYVAAFSVGDAQFFYSQNETQKREFFDTLGRERALPEAASHILVQSSRLVSFAYVLPHGEGNCHISCMCVHPDFQGRGLGKLSLQIIQKRAAAQGYKTITLGTETEMRAFQLYRKYGFAVGD